MIDCSIVGVMIKRTVEGGWGSGRRSRSQQDSATGLGRTPKGCLLESGAFHRARLGGRLARDRRQMGKRSQRSEEP